MPNWYYEKKELRNTPTIQAGIGFETETRYRREGSRFIQELGKALGLRHDTMATGSVYFHRFYMFHSFTDFPRYVTATCALFLAGKAEETPKKCRDIIKTVRSLTNDHQFATFGQDPREEVMTLERVLLQTIKFDLQVDHPYSALIKYAKCLKGDKTKLQKMVQMSWTFVNDSLCTTLCLQCEPEVTAIALMYLAAKLSKFEVKDWKSRTTEHKHWWDQYVQYLETDQLEDICHQVLDLYSQPTIAAKEAPMSPPPGAAPKPVVPPADPPAKTHPPSQPVTPRSQQPPPPKNPPHKPVPPSQPAVAPPQPQPQQPGPSSTYPPPSFNTPKTSHPVRGPAAPQAASTSYHGAPPQTYPVPQYQSFPPTMQNGPHQTNYPQSTGFSSYPPPQSHQGPPPQSHQGPPPQSHQGPPPQSHQGPPPQSHQGHPPPSHQGPPPQTHSAPPPGYGYPARGPSETRGAPYTPEGRGGPPPRDPYNDGRRGPPPHESRDGPPPFRGPRPEFGRGGGDSYRGSGGHDNYRGSGPPRGGNFHRGGGPPRRDSPYSNRPPHRGGNRGRY